MYLEDLCFNAQQCAEKAVKAVFIARRLAFPFVHDLKRLLTLLGESGLKIPKYVWESSRLSPYAVATRYPDLYPPVSARQYRRAVRIAEAVLRWAERQVAAAVKKRDEMR